MAANTKTTFFLSHNPSYLTKNAMRYKKICNELVMGRLLRILSLATTDKLVSVTVCLSIISRAGSISTPEQEGFRPSALNPNLLSQISMAALPLWRRSLILAPVAQTTWKNSFSTPFEGSNPSHQSGSPNGAGGIRTPVTRKGKTVFKTVAFSHSATAPKFQNAA